MRVLVVGSGGVGSAVAPIVARRTCFERVVFADIDLSRAQSAAARDERFGAAQLDAGDATAIADLARAEHSDAILNAAALPIPDDAPVISTTFPFTACANEWSRNRSGSRRRSQ